MATNKLIDLSRLSRFWDKVKNYIDTNDNAIVDKIYPVGSIYMSVTDSTAAAVEARFGGTWVSFGSGKTLVGVDGSDTDFDTVEETGGAKSVTLTSAQSGVPAHNHNLNQHTHSIPDHNHTFGGSGIYTDYEGSGYDYTYSVIATGSGNSMFYRKVGVAGTGSANNHVTGYASGAYSDATNASWPLAAHTHNYEKLTKVGGILKHRHSISSQNTSTKTNFSTNAVSSSATTSNNTAANAASAHTNLQPYITVYMYKRTA